MKRNELKSLISKVELIFETQKLILEKLDQRTLLTKEPVATNKKPSKEEMENRQLEEFRLVFIQGNYLKLKFNLAVRPHGSRILHYLRTNDPKAFDGLKRDEN